MNYCLVLFILMAGLVKSLPAPDTNVALTGEAMQNFDPEDLGAGSEWLIKLTLCNEARCTVTVDQALVHFGADREPGLNCHITLHQPITIAPDSVHFFSIQTDGWTKAILDHAADQPVLIHVMFYRLGQPIISWRAGLPEPWKLPDAKDVAEAMERHDLANAHGRQLVFQPVPTDTTN